MKDLAPILALAVPAFAPADTIRAGGSGPVAEIVTFRLAGGVTEAVFLDAARATEPIVRAAPGFLARRLTRGEDGFWTDCVEWSGRAEAEAAAARITNPGPGTGGRQPGGRGTSERRGPSRRTNAKHPGGAIGNIATTVLNSHGPA